MADEVTTETSPAAETAPTPIDWRARLIELLGLAPESDDAAIQASIDAILGLKEKAGAVDTLQAELDKIRAEYQALNEREMAAQKARNEAEVDDILATFADRFANDEGKAGIRSE